MGLTFVLLVMAMIYLPVLLLVFLSFSNGLQYYVELFTNAHYLQAIGNTLLIAVVSSIIATLIATMAATGIIYMGKKAKALTMTLNQLPIVNADIVTSFSLVLLFVGLGLANFGLFKLILAHVLIALPFCLLTILPKIRQLDTNLIDAALDLGASPMKAFTSVLVPQLVPAMLQAFLLGFTLSLDDFVITQYNNSGVATISTVVYGAISRRDIPNAFKALTAIIFAVILIVLVLMNIRSSRQRRGQKFGKRTVAIITAVVVLLAGGGIIPLLVNNLTPRSSVLKIYNWEDYIAIPTDGEGRDLVAEFADYYRELTGDQNFRVEYHTFTDNEELYSKIKTQRADYDLIFPSEYMVEKMADENLLQTIDLTKLDAAIVAGLDADILARTTAYTATADPNQVWAIPYMVGTVGIMYDTDVIDGMADATGIDTATFEQLLENIGFGVLFGEEYQDEDGNTYDSSKFKGHITMKKSARDSVGIAMLYAERERIRDSITAHQALGDDADAFDNTELSNILNMGGDFTLDQARQVLTEQIRVMNPFYENDNGKKAFADPHDTRFAYGLFWSCDAGLTIGENVDANGEQLENLKFYAPYGTNLWTDNFAIPTYAKNNAAAYAFMNYLLDPDNAADNIDYVGSQMAVADQNAAGENTAVGDLKDDYGYDPDAEDGDFDFANSYVNAVFPPDYALTYSAIMHNFNPVQETAVNDLMVSIQNQAAQLTESDGSSVHVIRWLFWALLSASIIAATGYYLTHRRPRDVKTTTTDTNATNDKKHRE